MRRPPPKARPSSRLACGSTPRRSARPAPTLRPGAPLASGPRSTRSRWRHRRRRYARARPCKRTLHCCLRCLSHRRHVLSHHLLDSPLQLCRRVRHAPPNRMLSARASTPPLNGYVRAELGRAALAGQTATESVRLRVRERVLLYFERACRDRVGDRSDRAFAAACVQPMWIRKRRRRSRSIITWSVARRGRRRSSRAALLPAVTGGLRRSRY